MLKARIIICLTFNEGVLFRTKRFVPDYRYTMNFLDVQSVDEVFCVDVSPDQSLESHEAMLRYGDECFAPVTMGGHVRTEADVEKMFDLGADKVLIHGHRTELISRVSKRWGAQAAVAGIEEGMDASLPVEAGAGEIFYQSIERDGSLAGYDLEGLRSIVRSVPVPVVVGGGCGSWKHMMEGIQAGATGVATTVIHHFTTPALKSAKRWLKERGIPIVPEFAA